MQGTSPPLLIERASTLLYWIFFRSLALRRYARSIHQALDEHLQVWQVRGAVADDPRFQVLCRARSRLLARAPLLAVLLFGGACMLFGIGFTWWSSLVFAVSYTIGAMLADRDLWDWPRVIAWARALFFIPFTLAIIAGVLSVLVPQLLPSQHLRAWLPDPSLAAPFAAVGVVFGMAGGVMYGVMYGVAFGMAFSVALGVAGGGAGGGTYGVALGVVLGMAYGMMFGIASGIKYGVAFGVLFGVAFGVLFGVAVSVAFLIAFLRLPMYLWELPRCLQLTGQALRRPDQAARLWRRQPLHFDEVIQLPLYGLAEHIAAIGRSDPPACLEALADAGASLRQQWAAPAALALVLGHELQRCSTVALIGRFAGATAWLPSTLLSAPLRPLLAELQSISADTAQALGAATRATREQGLQRQATRVREQRLALGRADRAALRGYAETLKHWQMVLDAAAQAVAQERTDSGELPPRYVAGSVLASGDPAFQGRADLFRTLEHLLINARTHSTPLLLGQPRTGKSSALSQLPRRLGAQALAVYLNMEGRTTASTAAGLIDELVRTIRAAAEQHSQPLHLPPIDEGILRGDPYRVFLHWLTDVQAALGEQRWLLLALDEFDRIDEAVRDRGIDSRIFGMLREIIEQYPRVALALSGNYTLAESDVRWSEALKSVRTIPVTFLPADDARRVLTQPAADFPAGVYSEAAITRVVTLTGGQPYLIHLIGELVVNRYNQSRANGITPDSLTLPLAETAIDAAADAALVAGDTSFASIWQWALRISNTLQSSDARIAPQLLHALAHGRPIDPIGLIEERQLFLDSFCERDVLAVAADGSYRFCIPLFAAWIRRQRRLRGS